MTAYIDSSVFLRILLNQKGCLKEFQQVTKPVASLLLKTEVLRTIDRLRVTGKINEDQFVTLTSQVHESLNSVEFIRLSDSIVSSAGASQASGQNRGRDAKFHEPCSRLDRGPR